MLGFKDPKSLGANSQTRSDQKELKLSEMETSLRFGGNSQALRIHAKQKFPIDPKTHLQVHGVYDTGSGAPGFFSAIVRHFYPNLSANLGIGLLCDKHEKLRYTVRGKKSFSVMNDGLLRLNIKGQCEVDREFREKKSRGAAEVSWAILNFQKDQDVRLKVGYEVFDKVPYLQLRENNWTLNVDANGKWNCRFDL